MSKEEDPVNPSLVVAEGVREANLYTAVQNFLKEEGITNEGLEKVDVIDIEDVIQHFPGLVDRMVSDENVQKYLHSDDEDDD